MSIRFDPKSKADSVAHPLDLLESAFQLQDANQNSETGVDPSEIKTEMNLLFAGANEARRLRKSNPMKETLVPDLTRDILGPIPQIDNRSKLLATVIDRYILLRETLIERRNNFSHTLEEHLQPAEALDIFDRIETIDRTLVEVEKNIQKAEIEKAKIEKRERLAKEAEMKKRKERASGA